MRYVLVKNSNEPRLAYVGTNGYPGTTSTKAFVCINSTGQNTASNSRVELSAHALGILGFIPWFNSLGSKVYTGSIPTQLSAISLPLTKASSDFSVTAALYQNGKLIDTVTSMYSCKVLGGNCSTWPQWGLAGVVVLFVLLIVIIVIVLVVRMKKKDNSSGSTPLNSR